MKNDPTITFFIPSFNILESLQLKVTLLFHKFPIFINTICRVLIPVSR